MFKHLSCIETVSEPYCMIPMPFTVASNNIQTAKRASHFFGSYIAYKYTMTCEKMVTICRTISPREASRISLYITVFWGKKSIYIYKILGTCSAVGWLRNKRKHDSSDIPGCSKSHELVNN